MFQRGPVPHFNGVGPPDTSMTGAFQMLGKTLNIDGGRRDDDLQVGRWQYP